MADKKVTESNQEKKPSTADELLSLVGEFEELYDALLGIAELADADRIIRHTGHEVTADTGRAVAALLWTVIERFNTANLSLSKQYEALKEGGTQ